MIRIRQITPEELFVNKDNLQQYLQNEFSLVVNKKTWMTNWEQLANRFQLFKFESMSEEESQAYGWDTELVEQIIRNTIEQVSSYFTFEKLNITVVPALPFPWFQDLNRSQWINGFTNGINSIQIAVPPNPDIEFLKYLIAHEAHHAYHKNPIYQLTLETFTLLDWLKMEGTAEYFSLSLFKDERWWKGNFPNEVEKCYWESAKNYLQTVDEQIKGPLCFGNSSKGLPMMCGYSFGYQLIQTFMKKYSGIELGDLFFIEPMQLITAYDKNFVMAQAFEAFDQENWLEAERLYRGIVLQSDGEDKELLDSAIHMLAFTLAMNEKFQEALLLYEQLLHQAQKIKNRSNEAVALHQIGMVFRMDKKYQEALKFFNMEKVLRESELQNDFVGFSANAYELGQIALEEKGLEEAYNHFTQSLEHGEKVRDLICIGCAHRGLGHYFYEIGNLSSSQHSFEKSIFAFEQAGDLQGAQKVRELLNDLKRT